MCSHFEPNPMSAPGRTILAIVTSPEAAATAAIASNGTADAFLSEEFTFDKYRFYLKVKRFAIILLLLGCCFQAFTPIRPYPNAIILVPWWNRPPKRFRSSGHMGR